MTRLLPAAFAAALATAALAMTAPLAAKPAVKPAAKPAAGVKWDTRLVRTPAGNHFYGNPAAKVKLVEYISYTCPHCAHYAMDSKAPLFTGPVRQGTVSVELRAFFRNPIDISATLLAQCGTSAQFFGNHHAILAAQPQWLRSPSDAEVERWTKGTFAARMKAIAVDLGLYKLMQGRGYAPAVLDKCLADQPLAEKLANQTNNDATKYNIQGTPSFLINGQLQDVYDWANLKPRIDAALK